MTKPESNIGSDFQTHIESHEKVLFNRISETYSRKDQVPSSKLAREFLILSSVRHIINKKKDLGVILDAGCGIGTSALYLQGKFQSYCGIDQSVALLKAGRKLFGDRNDISLVAANIKNAPLSDNIADTVLVLGALHHMTDLGSVMNELRRLAKPGADFVAIEPSRGNPIVQGLRHIRKKVDKSYSSDQVYFSERGLRELAAMGGLLYIEVEYQGFFSPPFAQVVLSPQVIFRPLSLAATKIDKWLFDCFSGASRFLAWNIVLYGRFP